MHGQIGMSLITVQVSELQQDNSPTMYYMGRVDSFQLVNVIDGLNNLITQEIASGCKFVYMTCL